MGVIGSIGGSGVKMETALLDTDFGELARFYSRVKGIYKLGSLGANPNLH